MHTVRIKYQVYQIITFSVTVFIKRLWATTNFEATKATYNKNSMT